MGVSRCARHQGAARGMKRERDRRADARRREDRPWRKLYCSPRWQRLREFVLNRDQRLCQRCLAEGVVTAANVVNHKIRHGGDPDLIFCDPSLLEAVCEACHNGPIQGEERAEAKRPASAHPEWLRPSLIPLTIVCGPAASGKSAWIAARAERRDLVLDLDELGARMSGQASRLWDRTLWLGPALRRRNALLGQLSKPGVRWPRAWLIVQEPDAAWRRWWDDKLRPERIVVLETPASVCLERIAADPERRAALETQRGLVASWWRRYQRRAGELVVSCDGGRSKSPNPSPSLTGGVSPFLSGGANTGGVR